MAKKAKTNIINNSLSNKEKAKAMEETVKAIRKNYGDGAVIKLGDKPTKMPVFPTGIIPLDMICGVGGFPKGRIIEIYGPESSGKTTIALKTVATTQKNGGFCVYIDAENALNLQHAINLGVNVDELYLCQPDSGETGLDIVESFVRSGAADLIVVDSVAALTPLVEIEGEMGDANVGVLARLMSKALRKLIGIADSMGTTVIFINQLREKVGVFYGNPETTPGGRALKFYSSIRLDVRKRENITEGSNVVGAKIKVKTVKNKVAAPFRETEFELNFENGIQENAYIIECAVNQGIIHKSGAWYVVNEEKFQGMDNVKRYLETNKEYYEKLKKETLKNCGLTAYLEEEDLIEENEDLEKNIEVLEESEENYE